MSTGAKIGLGITALIILLIVIGFSSFISMRNSMVKMDEDVNTGWAQVQNVYQRRADLIPNLVETVKGYAAHENETLTAVTEARARLGGVTQLNANDLTSENLARFQQAQAGLGAALQRLMMVTENYPELKANENFIRLQDELSGTENRIATERRWFNEAVKKYNTYIRMFPQSMIAGMAGFVPRPYFQADEAAQTAPQVKF